MDGCERHTCIERVLCSCVPREKKKKIVDACCSLGDRFLFSSSVSSMPVAVVRSAAASAAPRVYSGASPNRSREISFFFPMISSSARAPPTNRFQGQVRLLIHRARSHAPLLRQAVSGTVIFFFFFFAISRAPAQPLVAYSCSCWSVPVSPAGAAWIAAFTLS